MKPSLAFAACLLLSTSCIWSVSGLKCYKCSVPPAKENGEQDLTCLKAPQEIKGSLVTCLSHQKACRTSRIDHKETGAIRSFVRECSYPGENSVKDKPPYIIYYQYCQTDECNKGNGIDGDKENPNQRITAILIPDITGSAGRTPRHELLLLVPIVLSILANRRITGVY